MNRSVRSQLRKFGIGFLIGSGLLLWLVYREWHGRQASSKTPEDIPLKDLIARGPQGNPHVRVTHFVPCHNYAATETNERGEWSDGVYVPVVPGKMPAYNQPLPEAPEEVPAFFFSRKLRKEEDLSILRNPSGIRGLVINQIDPPNSRHRKALQERYPGTDLSRCVIVEERREPMPEDIVWGLAVLGMILGVVGPALLILAGPLSGGTSPLPSPAPAGGAE